MLYNIIIMLKKNYFIGILWFFLSLTISVINDLFTKYLGKNLHSFEITFFRFLFSTLSIIPLLIIKKNNQNLKTNYIKIHFLRALILFSGIVLWCFSLSVIPISTAITINFTVPLITLLLASFILKEKIGLVKWISTIIGFLGVLFILKPNEGQFNIMSLCLLIAAIMFSCLDILNKKFSSKEPLLNAVFYTALIVTMLSIVPTYFVWQTPSLKDLGILFIVGSGANLLFYCILKALNYVDASSLAPYRYFEIIFSSILGYLLFSEIPNKNTLIGYTIIIPITIFIMIYENMQKKLD